MSKQRTITVNLIDSGGYDVTIKLATEDETPSPFVDVFRQALSGLGYDDGTIEKFMS